jgi:hypothetical protein
METLATLLTIASIISIVSILIAWILSPKGISDDVMQHAHGDVPRIDWE